MKMPRKSISNLRNFHEIDKNSSQGSDSQYRDLSKAASALQNIFLSDERRKLKFPVILHQILSDSSYSEIITWLPHGRSWIVLDPKAFEKEIIPKFFDHSKFSSFFRQVNGWGFIRVKYGKDQNSYYHEYFLRGIPELASQMTRPIGFKKQGKEGAPPDFYKMSVLPTRRTSTCNEPRVFPTSCSVLSTPNSPQCSSSNTSSLSSANEIITVPSIESIPDPSLIVRYPTLFTHMNYTNVLERVLFMKKVHQTRLILQSSLLNLLIRHNHIAEASVPYLSQRNEVARTSSRQNDRSTPQDVNSILPSKGNI